MCEVAVVAQFEKITWYFAGGAHENNEKLGSGIRFEPATS
jgi:hypothetical protein